MRGKHALLLVLLGLLTGVCDATTFVRLGHVFASVVTGNLVVLGVSAVRGDRTDLVSAVCAVGGYALGAFAAAPTGRTVAQHQGHSDESGTWPAATTARLAAEAGLLVVFAVAWELEPHPGRWLRLGLLVLLACAMGVQTVAVRPLGSVSTTYLTGTFTSVLEAVRSRQWSPDRSRDLAILIGVVAGAAVALVVIEHARAVLPALQLGLLAIVLISGSRTRGSGGAGSASRSARS
jgi:uncharacterized membrane protein YoaK (UPF0700 family)